MLVEKFLDLDIEKQSLYIRGLFEAAARNYSQILPTGQKEPILVINAQHAYIDNLGDDNVKILTAYNEDLFPEANFIPMGDEVHMIRVSRETLSRYCSAEALSKIKEIAQIDTEDNWRHNEEIFDASGGEPLIVFRGMTNSQLTPGYFYCDAHTIISQQLINYQQVMGKIAPQETNLFGHLSFPVVEGRGAVFCFDGVPFHAYNSRLYNELLGAHLELFHRDISKAHWEVSQQKLLEKGFSYTSLVVAKGVSLLPEISRRQTVMDYVHVIRIPLAAYIAYSLEYQRSLELQDRIPVADNEARANDGAIDLALQTLRSITVKPAERINVTTGPSFFKHGDVSHQNRQMTPDMALSQKYF